MTHSITALQARAISNLARKHRSEALDLQERHFTEMQALELELFGPQQIPGVREVTIDLRRYELVEDLVPGTRTIAYADAADYLDGPNLQRLRALGVGHGMYDSKGRHWTRKA